MGDVELALMALLDDVAYTVTSTPERLEELIGEHGGVIRIRRVGGGGDADNDYPRVSLQHFAIPTADAPRPHVALSAVTERRLRKIATYGPELHAGVCIESPGKDSGPIELIYENDRVRVAETIWRLTTRHPEE